MSIRALPEGSATHPHRAPARTRRRFALRLCAHTETRATEEFPLCASTIQCCRAAEEQLLDESCTAARRLRYIETCLFRVNELVALKSSTHIHLSLAPDNTTKRKCHHISHLVACRGCEAKQVVSPFIAISLLWEDLPTTTRMPLVITDFEEVASRCRRRYN